MVRMAALVIAFWYASRVLLMRSAGSLPAGRRCAHDTCQADSRLCLGAGICDSGRLRPHCTVLDMGGTDPQLRPLRGCAELSAILLFRHIARQAEEAGTLSRLNPQLLVIAQYTPESQPPRRQRPWTRRTDQFLAAGPLPPWLSALMSALPVNTEGRGSVAVGMVAHEFSRVQGPCGAFDDRPCRGDQHLVERSISLFRSTVDRGGQVLGRGKQVVHQGVKPTSGFYGVSPAALGSVWVRCMSLARVTRDTASSPCPDFGTSLGLLRDSRLSRVSTTRFPMALLSMLPSRCTIEHPFGIGPWCCCHTQRALGINRVGSPCTGSSPAP